MKFILTIDTEADYPWTRAAPVTTHNVRCIPRFQALCERYGLAPTYLCTHDVVSDPVFDDILLPLASRGAAEIGAHLHPWSNPPFDPAWDATGQSFPYPSELPAALVARKLQHLTGAIAERLGIRPRSYRAGRWGFSASQIPALLDLGYLVDASVTPHIAWRDPGARGHGQDFTGADAHPYMLSIDDPCRPGASGLVEVPVTILYTNALMRRSRALQALQRRYRKSIAAQAMNRVFRVGPQWFRPFWDMSVTRLRAVFDTASDLGLPVVQMMFHSYELLPEGSPHSPTAAHVERLYERLEGIFGYLVERRVEPTTLTGFASKYVSDVQTK